RGWPAVCLRSETTVQNIPTVPGQSMISTRWGISVEHPSDSQVLVFPRTLPLRPIWSGLAMNFVVFVAAWLMLFTAPSVTKALRRATRARKGVCRRCGYDIRYGTGSACPECGEPV